MQPQISTQQVTGREASEYLLQAVQTAMIERIRSGKTPVSKQLIAASNAAMYHLNIGGQRVRAKLALQAGLALGLTEVDAVTIASTVELLHNASLIHDDIQDCEKTRRGQRAVWIQFDTNTAICAGDLLLSAAYACLAKIQNPNKLPAMISLVHERIATAIDGQCADLTEPIETGSDLASAIARYERIAIAKSGALLCLPVELSLLAAGETPYLSDARDAVEAFAVGYQIVDDLNDVQTDINCAAARATFNIISIYQAAGLIEESIRHAKTLGRQHIGLAIESAARLPREAGSLLSDYARGLGKQLAQ